MKHVLLVVAVIAVVVCVAGTSVAQDQKESQNVVKLFKDLINKSKPLEMKQLLMDVDDPNIVLLPENYDRMEYSMQTFIESWKGKPFKLYNATIKGQSSGVVYMWSPETLNQIKFYTVRIKVGKDFKWFIRDTEIFEDAAYAGDEGELVP